MNNIELWAKRWGIQPGAVAELLEGMGVIQTDPPLLPGASEAAVQTAVRLGATADGGRLWRNNVGATTMDDGSFLRFGLANDSPAMNKQFKSSDLIGIRPVLIQPEHVGIVFGQFTAREVKRAGWKYSGTPREVAQRRFIEFIQARGGDASFTSSVF